MPKFIWRKINVWFWKESTRWTAVAVSEWTPKTNIDFSEKHESIQDESSIWVIVDNVDAHVVKRWAEWNVEWNVWVEAIWLALLNLFWSVSSAPATTWAFQHDFSVLNSNQHPSLTIWVSDNVKDTSFPLAMLESMTISTEVWWFVTFSANFMSQAWETAAHTVSYTTDYTLLAKNWTFKVADNLAWLDGADAKCIQSFEITITKNLLDHQCLWNIWVNDFINQQFTIEWNFTALYENDTDYETNALDWTKQAIRFSIADTNTTIWVSDNPTLEFDLASANFTEWSKDQSNDTVVNQTLTFKWLYSKSEWSSITWKLINTTATY